MPSLARLVVIAAVVIALWAPTAARALVFPDACLGIPASTPTMPRTRIVQSPPTGFEWRDAAIGSVATLALILLAAGGAMMLHPGSRASRR
jgi:hypothetical protein